MKTTALILIIALSGCAHAPREAYCRYPCHDNPNLLPLEPDYADKREIDQPGYKARNAAVLREEYLSGSTARNDAVIADLDYTIARSRLESERTSFYGWPVRWRHKWHPR